MKITHLSTSDLLGGAARAAYRLHTCLCQLGHQSHFLAQYKISTDPSVTQFSVSTKAQVRLRRGLKRRYLALSQNAVASLPPGSTFFTDDRCQHNADVLTQVPNTDIVNLHWVAGFIDYREFFRQAPPALKLVWTMHDMNPFTGGCHYDDGCHRYRQKCGMCPQLGSTSLTDFSARVWARKKEAFSTPAARRLHLVAPSRWLAGEARQSSLFSGYDITVIPNGIDTNLFQPRDMRQAREQLDVPRDSSIVLFVADSVDERRKGFSFLVKALQLLKNTPDLYFLAVGRGASSIDLGQRVKTVGYVADEKMLSLVYSAADLFVLPSLQDNLPNTAIEALACGTPTVAFHVGGIPEIVRNGHTGVTVSPGDTEGLARAVEGLLGDPGRRATISSNCRRVAVEEYSLQIQAKRYEGLYSEMLRTG